MTNKVIKCLSFFSCLFISTASFSADKPILHYESSEHAAAGDQVKLYFSPEKIGVNELTLPNGFKITYGQLVSLGDFYGVVGQPISTGASDSERRSRFLAAFNSFAQNSADVDELTKILAIETAEKNAIDEGVKKGEKVEDIFARISDDNNRQWNCVTGGGCDAKTWFLKSGRYLALAKYDVDHFGDYAWMAYQTGHQLAIETAIAAHQTKDMQKLSLAYAMNGFACHYLSDRFASGHIRAPRTELPANVTPSVIGSLLVTFMHSEENAAGLHMHNLRGDRWMAFGDRYYFNPVNKMNVQLLQEALQISSDEIFTAFQQGTAPVVDTIKNIIPLPDEINNAGKIDVAPLFYWDSNAHIVYRRTNVANPEDRNWTSNWWGWSTLIELERLHKLTVEMQAQLVQAGYGEEAMQYGLITDETVLSFAKSKK